MKTKLRKWFKWKKWHRFLRLCIYFVLICVSFVYLEPLFRMVSMAFMSGEDIIDPSVEWLPKTLSVKNIQVASSVLNVGRTLLNSIWFSGLLAAAQTLVSAFTGFALSRYRFRFRNLIMVLIIFSCIIPVPQLMIPRLMMFIWGQDLLGVTLIGTPVPQLLMAALGQGVNSTILILIFYSFFNLVPKSLDEAAMIDGASPFRVFVEVAFRISATSVLVVFLFSFVWNWNETYSTGIFLRNQIELLPAKLNLFDSAFSRYASSAGGGGEIKINEAYKMSATLISIAPLVTLYAFVQKRFIQGIENTGITGE